MLSDYITQVRRLLHDATGQYWTDSELTAYINSSRNRLVRDTGCFRLLQIGAISAGQEAYSFNTGGVTGIWINSTTDVFAAAPAVVFTGGGGTGAAATAIMGGTAPNLTISSVVMTNPGANYTSAPAVTFVGATNTSATAGIIALGTFDILNVTLQWGTVRTPMDYMPFTQFNRNVRGMMQYTQRPTVFSSYGQNTVYLGPVPDQTYIVEWDSVILAPALVNPGDIDAILPNYTDPVPFYAAYLAKYQEGEMTEADRFRAEYVRQAKEAIGSSYTRRITSQNGG